MTNETPDIEEERQESETSAISFFEAAYYFLDTRSSLEATFENAMKLSELMEFDFRTMMEYRASCKTLPPNGSETDPEDDISIGRHLHESIKFSDMTTTAPRHIPGTTFRPFIYREKDFNDE
jgi:hypothetical protein